MDLSDAEEAMSTDDKIHKFSMLDVDVQLCEKGYNSLFMRSSVRDILFATKVKFPPFCFWPSCKFSKSGEQTKTSSISFLFRKDYNNIFKRWS